MLICLRRIYNFWVIHASFVILSHVFIIIYIIFYAFYWTNLLTRCPVPVPCFCCLFVSEIYFWKYSRIALEIYGDFLFAKMKIVFFDLKWIKRKAKVWLIRLKRIYNFWVIHASFVILPHVLTVIYIIFMHFVRLTYWQDA